MATAAALGAAAQPPQRPTVRLDRGALAGVRDGDVEVFRGIPYAAPPVGPLRWHAPEPAPHWRGVRDASHYGSACPQPGDHKDAWAQVGPTSEDCLFLNVWRPARGGTYPVMVFIHGGAFTYGAAGVPLYDGANLSRRGVVLVTINYRLGRLGFFAHPALTRADPNGLLGNYGIMDQIAALRWVKANIARFGGDPGNVTLFGESAGAGSVQVLMGSPAARGLFEKAISESGAGGSVLTPMRGTPNSAEAKGEQWASGIGLPNATAAQLRALPVSKLLDRAFPFIDGKVVVASPGVPFERGSEAKVPLLIGANSDESSLAGNSEAIARLVLGSRYEHFARAYAAAEPGKTAKAAETDLIEDALSVLPSMSIAAMHAANGAPAYDYYFDQVPANQRAGSAGTPHGGELEYLFGNPYAGSTWDQADRALSRRMETLWVAFARTGRPDVDGMTWKSVGTKPPLRYFTLTTPVSTQSLTPLREEVRSLSLEASSHLWRRDGETR